MSFTSQEKQGPNWTLGPSKVSDALAAKSGVSEHLARRSDFGSKARDIAKFPTSIAMVSGPAARVW